MKMMSKSRLVIPTLSLILALNGLGTAWAEDSSNGVVQQLPDESVPGLPFDPVYGAAAAGATAGIVGGGLRLTDERIMKVPGVGQPGEAVLDEQVRNTLVQKRSDGLGKRRVEVSLTEEPGVNPLRKIFPKRHSLAIDARNLDAEQVAKIAGKFVEGKGPTKYLEIRQNKFIDPKITGQAYRGGTRIAAAAVVTEAVRRYLGGGGTLKEEIVTGDRPVVVEESGGAQDQVPSHIQFVDPTSGFIMGGD